MRIIRESPLEEDQYAGAKQEPDECFSSSIFSLSPELLDASVTLGPSERMMSSKQDKSLENVEVQMVEHLNEGVIPEYSTQEIHSSQGEEILKELKSLKDTRADISEKDAGDHNTPPKVLAYGDLVVVDYAEKKKSYKWPAIVEKVGGVVPDNRLFLQAI